jgi:hypothetical protein
MMLEHYSQTEVPARQLQLTRPGGRLPVLHRRPAVRGLEAHPAHPRCERRGTGGLLLHADGRTKVVRETRRLDDVYRSFEQIEKGEVDAQLVFDFR